MTRTIKSSRRDACSHSPSCHWQPCENHLNELQQPDSLSPPHMNLLPLKLATFRLATTRQPSPKKNWNHSPGPRLRAHGQRAVLWTNVIYMKIPSQNLQPLATLVSQRDLFKLQVAFRNFLKNGKFFNPKKKIIFFEVMHCVLMKGPKKA